MPDISLVITRRRLLAALAAGVGAAALGATGVGATATTREQRLNHLAWVWQFRDDGPAAHTRRVLSDFGFGILLKTHDGPDWMGRWDDNRMAINGPGDVQSAASYFESAGVPFHAWCVVEGTDPKREAEMCAEVLSSGARSLTLDLEPREGRNYWQAGPNEALEFGQELRRLQPTAWVSVAPDPRPWQVKAVPMAEFASFVNEIAPQTYWETFNSSANYRLLRDAGHHVGPDGVTPELILDVTRDTLARYGRPIRPVGQGAAKAGDWQRFVSHAYSLGMDAVSIWRFGTCTPDVWPLLSEMRPHQPAAPVSFRTENNNRKEDEDKKDGKQTGQPTDRSQTFSSIKAQPQETTKQTERRDTDKKESDKSAANKLYNASDTREKEWRWTGEAKAR